MRRHKYPAARAAYLKQYDDPRFLGPITAMPVDEFVEKARKANGRMVKAFPIEQRVRRDGVVQGYHVSIGTVASSRETIDVDGAQRPAQNSNGKPIHSSDEGIRNFWRWHDGGDERGRNKPILGEDGISDINGGDAPDREGNGRALSTLDSSGRPRVYHHGTADDFGVLDTDHTNRKDKGRLVIRCGSIALRPVVQRTESRYLVSPARVVSPAGGFGRFDFNCPSRERWGAPDRRDFQADQRMRAVLR